MLWYKGWLETRFRVVFCLSFLVLVLGPMSVRPPATPHSHVALVVAPRHDAAPAADVQAATLRLFSLENWMTVMFACAMLGGAGIATQPAVNASKGLHGSTLFTVSLPVSRLRLLVVRAGIGWLEAVGVITIFCCGMWVVFLPLREMATPVELMEHEAVLIVCGSALYSLSVLLGTFLEEQWRVWGTMLVSAVCGWVALHKFLPAGVDVFRAMGQGSPLYAHAMPWEPMAFSVGLGAALLFAALKIARVREY